MHSATKEPLQRRSQETVRAIIEASAHILESQGIAKFNTNSVAIRAGVSIGSLYQFFPDKDAILVSLILQMKQHSKKRFEKALTEVRENSLESLLRTLVRVLIQLHRDRPVLYRVLEDAESRLIGPYDPLGLDRDLLRWLSQLLQSNSNQLQVKNYKDAASDIFSIGQALIHRTLSKKGVRWKSLEDRVVRAVYGYLTCSPRLTLLRPEGPRQNERAAHTQGDRRLPKAVAKVASAKRKRP